MAKKAAAKKKPARKKASKPKKTVAKKKKTYKADKNNDGKTTRSEAKAGNLKVLCLAHATQITPTADAALAAPAGAGGRPQRRWLGDSVGGEARSKRQRSWRPQEEGREEVSHAEPFAGVAARHG